MHVASFAYDKPRDAHEKHIYIYTKNIHKYINLYMMKTVDVHAFLSVSFQAQAISENKHSLYIAFVQCHSLQK